MGRLGGEFDGFGFLAGCEAIEQRELLPRSFRWLRGERKERGEALGLALLEDAVDELADDGPASGRGFRPVGRGEEGLQEFQLASAQAGERGGAGEGILDVLGQHLGHDYLGFLPADLAERKQELELHVGAGVFGKREELFRQFCVSFRFRLRDAENGGARFFIGFLRGPTQPSFVDGPENPLRGNPTGNVLRLGHIVQRV